jgi:alkanesulfonate monooxygenase SsuD/methylene tetrahydromethanopterin reductase-like flavin-dependent oxidoreductase (luciferase family)
MTYLAGVCPDIDLGTAAVILPWHDPLRVAEQAAVLDLLCRGRLRLGFGRGLARREFAAFRETMDESRGRFDEGAPMIISALRSGWIEVDGLYYKQPQVERRPRPKCNFDGRIYAVASSEDSVDSAARLGAHMVMFSDREAPRMMITDFCICAPRLDAAEAMARRYMGKFVESNFDHYEFLCEHFTTVKGYDAYAQKAEIARKGGIEGAVDGFMKAAVWGTPDRVLRELEARRGVIGDFELNVAFRFGGIPYDEAAASLQLFASEVLPILKSRQPPWARAAE